MSEGRPRPFHERFDIEVDTNQAKQHFINRITNVVFSDIRQSRLGNRWLSTYSVSEYDLTHYVANRVGEVYRTGEDNPGKYVRNDFYRCLQVLEALHEALENTGLEEYLSAAIVGALDMSETDLGVDWEPPVFVRTGARLLDERLVNEPMRWLSEPTYLTVLDPFQRGLSHYLEDRLSDAVTDMYEAVEALARILTGKDKDLSGNRESFIKSIKVSDHYKRLLKDYIEYGSEFRHAERLNKPRPKLTEPEVEAFIYLTGLVIRLAIRSTD